MKSANQSGRRKRRAVRKQTAPRRFKATKRKATKKKARKKKAKKTSATKTTRKKQWSVKKEFAAISRELRHCIVVYDLDDDQAWMREQLQTRNSEAIRILNKQFHRVIVLDIKKGVDALGRFFASRFLRYALLQMCDAFQLDIDPSEFHPGQVPQILKDELANDQQSLFCIVNADRLSEKGVACVRGFMLSGHKVLICGRNPHLDEDSFPTAWAEYNRQS